MRCLSKCIVPTLVLILFTLKLITGLLLSQITFINSKYELRCPRKRGAINPNCSCLLSGTKTGLLPARADTGRTQKGSLGDVPMGTAHIVRLTAMLPPP